MHVTSHHSKGKLPDFEIVLSFPQHKLFPTLSSSDLGGYLGGGQTHSGINLVCGWCGHLPTPGRTLASATTPCSTSCDFHEAQKPIPPVQETSEENSGQVEDAMRSGLTNLT